MRPNVRVEGTDGSTEPAGPLRRRFHDRGGWSTIDVALHTLAGDHWPLNVAMYCYRPVQHGTGEMWAKIGVPSKDLEPILKLTKALQVRAVVARHFAVQATGTKPPRNPNDHEGRHKYAAAGIRLYGAIRATWSREAVLLAAKEGGVDGLVAVFHHG